MLTGSHPGEHLTWQRCPLRGFCKCREQKGLLPSAEFTERVRQLRFPGSMSYCRRRGLAQFHPRQQKLVARD